MGNHCIIAASPEPCTHVEGSDVPESVVSPCAGLRVGPWYPLRSKACGTLTCGKKWSPIYLLLRSICCR